MNRNNWSNEKLFFRLLNNKSAKPYWDNIRILRKRPTKEVFDISVNLTHSKEYKAKEIGIDVLAQLGSIPRPFYSESIKLFFELLETEKDPLVLFSLLCAIGHNNEHISKTQVDKLCSFDDTNNALVKEGLIHSLLGIDNPKAIDTLIKLSSDKLNHIRDWATFGLGSLSERNNKKIREALWARVNDMHQDTRYEAIAGLALRKDTRVNEIIKRELFTEEYGSQLFEAIIAVQGTEFLPILRLHFKENERVKTINHSWLENLKNCIEELEKKALS